MKSDLDAARQSLLEKKGIYEKAINSGDLKSLESIFTRDASGVMITGDAVTSFSEIEKFHQSVMKYLGNGARHHVSLEPLPTEFINDIAIARGTSNDSVTMNGKDYPYQSQWTAIFQIQEGDWKCIRLHISLNPFNNAFIDAKVKSLGLVYGAIGMGAGMLIGLTLGALTRLVYNPRSVSTTDI